MTLDHTCRITDDADPDTRELDEWEQPIGEPESITIYTDECQVFEDEYTLRRAANGDESLQGWALVRLAYRPEVAPRKGQTLRAWYNGVERVGTIEGTAALAHFPRVKVRWRQE